MMTSQPFVSKQSSFNLLDSRIRKWIWNHGWTSLRAVQEQAIPLLLGADTDVIISATTSAGKTEAAFLPILSNIARSGNTKSLVLYVSPLKALINDQWRRLSSLAESLEIPVVGWHGDIPQSQKKKFKNHPGGVLLITPESLEGLLAYHGSELATLFAGLRYVVVDELHAFIGSDRGKQLQSILHRVDLARGGSQQVSRVGLSATLGDVSLAAQFLRPNGFERVRIISADQSASEVKVTLKTRFGSKEETEPRAKPLPIEKSPAKKAIADEIFEKLRTANHLVFPKSRTAVESFADYLFRRTEELGIRQIFWPHHGSLSKEIRENVEARLRDDSWPTVAICTSTLEMGIDIGGVKSVCQIGSPPSVSSLRQRIGRSGRKEGECSILRCYVVEPREPSGSPSDALHQELLQTTAMLQLALVERWVEPPRPNCFHASAFVQQVLSCVSQCGGISLKKLWHDLVIHGAFCDTSKDDFVSVLKGLTEKDLLVQASDGTLLLGLKGEEMVAHREFCISFETPKEFELECEGKSIGSLPSTHPIRLGQCLVLAGRRWKVIEVEPARRALRVQPFTAGDLPSFGGDGCTVHGRVREKMLELLLSEANLEFIDNNSHEAIASARLSFERMGRPQRSLCPSRGGFHFFTWAGDSVNDALVVLLSSQGIVSKNSGFCIDLFHVEEDEVMCAFRDIGKQESIDPVVALRDTENLEREKWDWCLPPEILRKSYASRFLDFKAALDLLKLVTR
jgi:ATP-dependent Lhr-like helicase